MDTSPQIFKVCLTMAGAVSAGAYTAGVIDYLMETLELWEQAKQRNRDIRQAHPDDYLQQGYDPSIPMHNVEIEVVSGASAGGITGTLFMISALEGIRAINRDNPDKKNNKLYRCWVQMADDEVDTMTHLLSTDDISLGKVDSLLNSYPIERIADEALNIRQVRDYPPYVSKDLDLILTISNLRGINYKINFAGNDPASGTLITNHSGFFRYRMKNEQNEAGIPKDEKKLYYVLDPHDAQDREQFKVATLSTAAFPIGLKPRRLSIPSLYIHRYSNYLFDRDRGIEVVDKPDEHGNFKFLSVDGGLINNEPFGYALKVLKEKFPDIEEHNDYAIIMIDPFPNYTEEHGDQDQSSDIFSVAKKVLTALRNQVMFKQDEIFNALDGNIRTRFLVAPSRKYKDEKGEIRRAPNPLACGAMGGFSGFLDRRFREHDFELGRKNCQSFLRYFFSLEASEAALRFQTELSDEALERFGFYEVPGERSTKTFFPIIPDIKVKQAYDNTYDESYGEDAKIAGLPFPQISPLALKKKYNKPLLHRVRALSFGFLSRPFHRVLMRVFMINRRIRNKLMHEIISNLDGQGLVKEVTMKELRDL